MSLATLEGKWIDRLLREVLTASNESGPGIFIFKSNQSVIEVTKNPVNHGQAKHLVVKYHHIRVDVKCGEVQLEFCKTSMMLAGTMTKRLYRMLHRSLLVALDIQESLD